MKHVRKLLSILIALTLTLTGLAIPTSTVLAASTLVVSGLNICYLKEPLGIDKTPIFSWKLRGSARGSAQTAYRIYVSSEASRLASNRGDLWDSGKITSDKTTDIIYDGRALNSKNTYYWKVEVWDEAGASVMSEAAVFSTGMLDPADWQGQWIGTEKKNYVFALTGAKWIWRSGGSGFGGSPAGTQYFRKNFEIDPAKTVKEVLIGWTADDRSALYLNGVERGTNNAWTSGTLFDATDYVKSGNNVIAAAAQNGVAGYAGFVLKAQITYTDNTVTTVVTDNTFKVSDSEQAGWYEENFIDTAWATPDQQVNFGDSPWGTGIGLDDASNRNETMLRKEFSVSKEIKEAYAYICGLGFFELTVNGELPDDSLLNPFTTQYNKTVLYRTFNVTDLLKSGGNAIGVELGNSYYNENGGVWDWQTISWRDNPKMIINLEIKYADNTSEIIVSDNTWKLTKDGPIISNSMYYGDTYDARREQNGFNKIGFDDSAWKVADIVDAPDGVLRAHMKEPVKRVAELTPESITRLDNGSYVIKSSEMASGWIKLMNINEVAGTKISLTYGQMINPDGTVIKWGGSDGDGMGGEFNHWWPHDYIQQDKYITKGTANESYEPKFSYKGHQYIQIDGLTGELTTDDFVIYRVSNDVDIISTFDSSSDYINTLHGMMERAMQNNFQGEHCDPVLEKNGWLGDANVSLPSLMYSFDMSGCLPGFTEVMEDCFDQYGIVPVMVPTADWWIQNAAVWNTLYVYGVRDLDNYYGMGEYSIEQYDSMREFALIDINEIKNNGWVWHDGQLADWVAPIGGSDSNVRYNENISEGSGIVGTCYVYGMLDAMAQLAERLGKTADAAEYRDAMSKIFTAFNAKFYDASEQIYRTTTWSQIGTRTEYRQTSTLAPLAYGLVPDEYVDGVVENLIKDIVEKDYHLDTGCVGTQLILPMLCDYGYEDVAYKILTQTTYPSWGFWVENGASSTWEMWESTTRSYDHYFLGTYHQWLYSHLAGVRDIKDGYKTFTVNPVFTGDLNYVDVKIDTVRGEVKSNWQLRDDGKADMNISVPVGATATICFPTNVVSEVLLDGSAIAVGGSVKAVSTENGQVKATITSGDYSFTTAMGNVDLYKTSLEAVISEAEKIDTSALTDEIKVQFESTLNNAKQLITTATIQKQINDALNALVEVIELAKGSEARQTLRALIKKCEYEVNVAHYTKTSALGYNSALLTAKKLCASSAASDEMLTKAAELLQSAHDELISVQATNLALSKNKFASSSNENDYWGWSLNYLNDGDRINQSREEITYAGYTSDLTPDVNHEEWVTIDLGAIQDINNTVIYPSASLVDGKRTAYGFPEDFEILVSDDNVTWQSVYEENGYPLQKYGPLSFDFETVSAQYVKLLAKKLRPKATENNSYRLQLAEMEVYNIQQMGVDDAKGMLYIDISGELLSPVFDISVSDYSVTTSQEKVSVTPYLSGLENATVNGTVVQNGAASAEISLDIGENTIEIVADNVTYSITLIRESARLRGDLDGNGAVNLADIVMMRNWIMEGSPTADRIATGDLDGNGSINLADIVELRNIIMGVVD